MPAHPATGAASRRRHAPVRRLDLSALAASWRPCWFAIRRSRTVPRSSLKFSPLPSQVPLSTASPTISPPLRPHLHRHCRRRPKHPIPRPPFPPPHFPPQRLAGAVVAPARPTTSPPTPVHPWGCKMHLSNEAIAPPSRFHRGATCTFPIGPMHPPTGTSPGLEVFTRMGLKWADYPHFSYESHPVNRCSHSPNSCTRLCHQAGLRKSCAPKGGVRTPSLSRSSGQGIHERPSTAPAPSWTRRRRVSRLGTCAIGHRPARQFRHTSTGPPKVPLLQYDHCNDVDTEPRQTHRPNRLLALPDPA